MNKHIQFGTISNRKLVSRILWWSILALIIVTFGNFTYWIGPNSVDKPAEMIQLYFIVQTIDRYISLIGVPIVSIVLLKLGCDILYKILKRVDPEDGQFGNISNRKLVSRIFWCSILALVIVTFSSVTHWIGPNSVNKPAQVIQIYYIVQTVDYYLSLIGVPLVSIALLKLGCDVFYKILKRVDPDDGTKKG